MPLEAQNGSLQAVGNYDLLLKIADGGMGSVYKARNKTSGELVAIKIVPPNMANNPTLLKRFEQEFRAASSLDHPNVVRAIDYGIEQNNTPYLVMEYVDGKSLGQRIDESGCLPEAESIRIIAQVAQGLHKAHKQNLIHRDVKPDNILIASDGQAKLADLGLVKIKELETDLNLTRTGRGLGTPHFMAPEQFRNAKNADVRCDIYSLGATLYMAVTGELPFRALSPLEAWMRKCDNNFPAPRDLVPTISERLDWAIRRAMSADPDQRPSTCREFVEDLTGRSTRKINLQDANAARQDVWYLNYTDEEGSSLTAMGSLTAIRRGLKEGRFGNADNVCVSRRKDGPFEPLRTHPEYRDLVVTPAAIAQSGSSKTVRPKLPSSRIDQVNAATKPLPAIQEYRPPAIDFGTAATPTRQTGSEWTTWIMVAVLLVLGFLVGLYFIGGFKPW